MTVTSKEELRQLQSEVTEKKIVIQQLQEAINSIILGQETVVEHVLIALINGGHILLEGVPGLAKTTLVHTIASLIAGSFGRVQFTPDLLPSDLIGCQLYNQHSGDFSIQKGPIFCNLLLADEINRAPAKVQSALLECMQEKQVTIAGESHALPESFFVMATQNPVEHSGTYELPEAQKDRFLFKTLISYPARDHEKQLLLRNSANTSTSPITTLEKLLELRELSQNIYANDSIVEYILDIIAATRSVFSPNVKTETQEKLSNWIYMGASPRASIALLETSRIYALLHGRAYVTPDDVKYLAQPILRHRIILRFEAEALGHTTDSVIEYILGALSIKND